MAETPDFQQIARQVMAPLDEQTDYDIDFAASKLREVWNARGQADQDAAVTRLSTLVGWASSEPYLKHIREAIAALDR